MMTVEEIAKALRVALDEMAALPHHRCARCDKPGEICASQFTIDHFDKTVRLTSWSEDLPGWVRQMTYQGDGRGPYEKLFCPDCAPVPR